MPRAEKSTMELKKDLDKIRERYERSLEKDNRKIADLVRKYFGDEPDLKKLYRETGMSTMMNKRVRYRMYRGEDHSSSGGALTKPNVLCLAPAGSRGSALSKLPKSHFGIACLYQKRFWVRKGGDHG